MEAVKQDLLRHSVKVLPMGESFTLKSGKKSRVYIDVRKTALHADCQMSLAFEIYDVLANGVFGLVHAVAGVALGGSHLASITSMYASMYGKTRLHTIHVRGEAKAHGTKSRVELPSIFNVESLGPTKVNVVLLEDVVTTGGSLSDAVTALREANNDKVNLNVVGMLAIVDRRDSVARVLPFTSDLIPCRSILTIEDLAPGLGDL